jgi:orotate phosphoribosyltransferase
MHPERKRGFIHQFVVRKSPKQYGLENKIEGRLEEPVIIVDDVFTSGKSIQKAIDAVRNQNLNIEGVICVLDREEEEGQQNEFKKAWGRRYQPLLRHSDFKDYIDKKLKQID